MPNWGVAKGGGGILGQLRDCSEFLVRGGGVWAMAGVQGKVAFGFINNNSLLFNITISFSHTYYSYSRLTLPFLTLPFLSLPLFAQILHL